MASKSNGPPEGYEPAQVENNDDDDDVPEIDLEEVGSINGTVVNHIAGEDDRGPWHKLRIMSDDEGLVDYWAKWDAKQLCNKGRIKEGVELYVYLDEEPESFTNDDGETVEKIPHRVAFPEDD